MSDAQQPFVDERLEAQALLAAVVESSEDAIVTKRLDGIITSWNTGAHRLFGYTPSEAIGQSITIIIPPDRLHEEKSIIDRLRRGERIAHYETERVTKTGRRVHVSLTISPIRDSQGRIVGASKIARDVTAQKLAQERLRESEKQLRAADRRKDEFLATLAHELRNPLSPIYNGLKLLPKVREDEAEFEQTRRMMETQLKHMVHLLDDLLDISRIGRNKIQLRKCLIELAWVVNDAVEATRPLLEDRNHQLSVKIPEEPVYLDADSVRLTQVLSNLLNNAAKYTNPGGRIALIAEVERSESQESGVRSQGSGVSEKCAVPLTPDSCLLTPMVVVRVRDNGLGISPDMLPRLFDLFVQGETHSSNAGGGLGIGLSLVKSLVEMHGGRVEAHSDGPDKGSEFVVRLPVAVQPSVEKPEEPQAEAGAGPPRRILVVDDNRASAESMARLLRSYGHEVCVAHDGPDALLAAAEFRPDVGLLDVGLPGMDGHELARALRDRAVGQRLTLIAMTGWGREEDRQRSLAAGFDAHLVKPIKMSAVCDLLAAEGG